MPSDYGVISSVFYLFILILGGKNPPREQGIYPNCRQSKLWVIWVYPTLLKCQVGSNSRPLIHFQIRQFH